MRTRTRPPVGFLLWASAAHAARERNAGGEIPSETMPAVPSCCKNARRFVDMVNSLSMYHSKDSQAGPSISPPFQRIAKASPVFPPLRKGGPGGGLIRYGDCKMKI